jgi:hypothetical protein
MKKGILISLGSVAIVLAPLVTVSCSSSYTFYCVGDVLRKNDDERLSVNFSKDLKHKNTKEFDKYTKFVDEYCKNPKYKNKIMLLILTPYQNKHEEKKINKYVLKFRGRD